MASQSTSLPFDVPQKGLDHPASWFWAFLKNEMTPYPGRTWVVARMTVAATIVMLLVMTFRLPNGFVGGILTIILSRESPAATLRFGASLAIAAAAGTAYCIVSIAMFVDDPLTHYLWVIGSLFLAFYVMRITPNFPTAVSFALPIAIAIPSWDANTVNINTRVEDTLWLGFLVIVGSATTIAVEYVLNKVHPTSILSEGIERRLEVIEEILRDVAADRPVSPQAEKTISQYAGLGTSTLRRILLRSGYSDHFIAQMNAAVLLLGSLVHLAANMRITYSNQPAKLNAEDRSRCSSLADKIVDMRRNLVAGRILAPIDLPVNDRPSNLIFLSEMERTVALIPEVFSGSTTTADILTRAPMDEDLPRTLFRPDAFTNPAHLKFALRGALAAVLCYVVYTAVDWQGLQTSILTCLVTAVSTIGSSRQRQILRLAGAIIGGLIFGMGAQVFVLPYVDSIVGFTVLFAMISVITAWFSTATPRISYLGLQIAVSFYLINLQGFTIVTSLAIARDRLFGVLLGLIAMWLIFDRLWVRTALDEMQDVFARTLLMFAELTRQLLRPDRNEAIKRIRQLREQINAGFVEVRAQSDAILFEFGPSRQRKLEIREEIRKWEPMLRTLLLVQLTLSDYRLLKPLGDIPTEVERALKAFNKDVERVMQVMADEVNGEPSVAAPDVQASAARVEEEIRKHSADSRISAATRFADVVTLVRSLTSIVVPLYRDIHIAFASGRKATPDALPLTHLDAATEL